MSIEENDPRLTAYVFGELSGDARAAFEAELASDESAREKLAELEWTIGALRVDFAAEKPQQLQPERRRRIAEVLTEARRKERRRFLWRVSVLGSMAASLLLLTTTLFYQRRTAHHVGDDALPLQYMAPSEAEEVAAKPIEPVLPAARPAPVQETPAPSLRAASPQTGPRRLSGIGDSPAIAPLMSPRGSRDSEQFAAPLPTKRTAPAVAAAAPAASVNAGEWDDNANYREFMRWLATDPAPPAHRLDIRERRFLVVRDAAGRGVPGCRVTVADESDRQTELITAATGRAILFPHAEGLVGRTLTATTHCAGGASKRFSLSRPDGVVDLRTSERRILPVEQTIDVAFFLDSTGSMSEEIAAVKTTIQKVAVGLHDSNVRIRIGLVEFKDRGDPFVTRVYGMSTDLERFSDQVANVRADGGGDTPESGNEALHVGIQQLAWSDAAIAKLAFLIGDAPPHLDYPQDYDYALEARAAAHRGIQIYTVAASGMDTLGQVVWRQVAQYTGATNLFVLRGGAGPQSSGAGDPKSSCGGTQTAYTSGNLDALVLAKIRGVIRSLERDPLLIPGLNTDENAKPCADRVSIAE